MSYVQIGKERDVGFIFNPLFMLVTVCLGFESVFELDFGSCVVLECAVCERKNTQVEHVFNKVGDFLTGKPFVDRLGV